MATGLPIQGTSFPSNFDVYPVCIGFPCASVPSAVSLIPAGVASNLSDSVRMGLDPNSDLAAFTFQVPTQLSPANAIPPTTTIATPSSRDRTNTSLRILTPCLWRI